MTMTQATDSDSTATDNVRPFPGAGPEPPQDRKARSKDRTGAARQAKYRSRNKGHRYERRPKDASSSPHVDAPPITPTVTQTAGDGVTHSRETSPAGRPAEHHLDRLTLLAALALATVSAGFSIYGMTSIFVGAFWPVIGMGVALELGKLRAVTWIGRNGSAPWWGLKGALAVLVLVLMGLNVVGAFGFLAKAHIGHQVEGETALGGRMAEIQGRISVQDGIVASLDRQIAQIDNAIAKATDRGRTNAARQLAADQKRNRAELVTERVRQSKVLADLQVEKASAEGQRRVAEADLGPVRYLATLLGADDQDVLRYFILVVAYCSIRPRCSSYWPPFDANPGLLHRSGGGAAGRDRPADESRQERRGPMNNNGMDFMGRNQMSQTETMRVL
jgi:hypothetical protein